ncbi:hypothetical protein KGF54_001221 [Candida jiufengensis]|uniref:uncharacterized protein n=1 Tax=Candida jiufengensis TaxID=497108 RepID=UPI0022248B44|nr:uncharacterized protein KGF54_001221 [Candida jiufengensis]KAI5955719.1 hypothetical protein KGF54_001221 [Candida jiufengensis]
MSLPRETILEALDDKQIESSNINEELLMMIRDEFKTQVDLKLLTNFSKFIFIVKKSYLIVPILNLYTVDYPIINSNEVIEFEDFLQYYKYTAFNLTQLILDDSTFKSQASLFNKIYYKLIGGNEPTKNDDSQPGTSTSNEPTTTTTTINEDLINNQTYQALAKSVKDLSNRKPKPQQVSQDTKIKIKYKNLYLKLTKLFENSGLNNFPLEFLQSSFNLSKDVPQLKDEINLIFAGQNKINFEITDENVLILSHNVELRSFDDLLKTQLEIAKLNQALKDILV